MKRNKPGSENPDRIINKNPALSNKTVSIFISVSSFFFLTAPLVNFLLYNGYSLFAGETLFFLAVAVLICLMLSLLSLAWPFIGLAFVSVIILSYITQVVPYTKILDRIIDILSPVISLVPAVLIADIIPGIFGIILLIILFKWLYRLGKEGWLGLAVIALLISPFALWNVAQGVLIIMLASFLYVGLKRLGGAGWRGLCTASVVIFLSTAIANGFTPALTYEIKIDDVKQNKSSKPLPVFIHIILDEHESIDRMRENIKEARLAKKKIFEFYEKYGFRLFTNAFSHYYPTHESIPNSLNFSHEQKLRAMLKEAPGMVLAKNKEFDLLVKNGYDIRIYQTNFLNFCESHPKNTEFCMEYTPNRVGDIQQTSVGFSNRLLLIVGHYIHAYKAGLPKKLLTGLRRQLRSFLVGDRARIPILSLSFNSLGPISVKKTFSRLKEDVLNSNPNKAYFAHLVIPHFAYVYNADGSVRPDPRTWQGPSDWFGTKDTPPMEERLRYYYLQVMGLYSELDIWFSELKEKGILDDAVVILHGDHGSRVVKIKPMVKTATTEKGREMIKDGFSTLFAIKSPNLKPGRVSEAKAIEALLRDYFLNPENIDVPASNDSFLYLIEEKTKRHIKLPISDW